MQVKTTRTDKILEMTFCILAMIGSLLLSNKIYEGWILFAISSGIGAVWAYRGRFWWAVVMQVFFMFTNIIGIYNYLV